MFIPPDGAMQFEINNHPLGFNGSVLWCVPDQRTTSTRVPGCQCSNGDFMKVVGASHLTQRFNFNQGARDNLVCRCIGRIIE